MKTEADVKRSLESETDIVALDEAITEAGRRKYASLVPLIETHTLHASEQIRAAAFSALIMRMCSEAHLALAFQSLNSDPSDIVRGSIADCLGSMAWKFPRFKDVITPQLAERLRKEKEATAKTRAYAALLRSLHLKSAVPWPVHDSQIDWALVDEWAKKPETSSRNG